MLIKCPKCGFSQPKDKYCAQCGLDIETYRPPDIPFFKQLFSDPIFHLFAVLVVALGAGFYIYKNNKSEIQDRVSFFRQGIQYARNMNNDSASQSSTEGGVASEESEVPNEMMTGQETQGAHIEGSAQPPAPAPITPQNAAGTAAAPTATADANQKAANDGKSVVRIQYVEVAMPLLDLIYNESRTSGMFNSLGDHVAGLWPQARKKIETQRGWKVLGKETKTLEVGRPLQFFVGLKGSDPENDLGLTTYVEITGYDGAGIRGQLEVVRAWREVAPDGTSAIQRRFYPAAFDIPSDAYFFLASVLPRGSPMENDPYLTNIDPFKILKTNFFKNRETEFLLVLDFDK